MPTLERARVIQKHMGGSIYWDEDYECFRVMQSNSPALRRWWHAYQPIEIGQDAYPRTW